MVKGNSRQVIVVHNPDQKLFDQAIFILRDDAVGKDGITEDMLLKSADKILRSSGSETKPKGLFFGLVWAVGGGLGVGLMWLLTLLI